MKMHHTGIAGFDTYVDGVLSGKIDVCGFAKKAIHRHVDDMAKAQDDSYPYYFEKQAAIHFFDFAYSQCEHYEGDYAGEPIDFLPWQQFVFGSIFGWLKKSTKKRRFRETHIEIPKKNGKSIIGAIVALYGLDWDNEPGAQIYNLATNRTHAMKLSYRAATVMVEKSPVLSQKMFVNKSIATMRVACPSTDSFFEPLTSKPDNLDGFNVHMSINDETKDWKDKTVYDLISDGTAARSQPLILNITTAGSDQNSLGYDHRQMAIDLLQGTTENERFFCIIYTIDEEDMKCWDEERIWRKANPSYGVSVHSDYFETKISKAQKSDMQKNDFLTKHLNCWVAAMTQWMNMDKWNKCANPDLTLSDFTNDPAYIAMDLASNLDLVSLAMILKRDGKYRAFTRSYISQRAVDESKQGIKLQYLSWAKKGDLIITPGETTDYNFVEEDLRELLTSHNIQAVGFDPYQSNYMINNLSNSGVKVVKVPQQVKTLSQPMKNLEGFVYDEKIEHNDKVLSWCMGNIVAKEDRKGNIFPNKEDNAKKIDAGVALIMAFALELSDPLQQRQQITGRTWELT